MAGFFGLFNYEKEGPGIAKDAPKKKRFIVFLETFKRNFWKFIPISLLYLLLSIPVLTNGFANIGITHVMRNTERDKHSFGASDFFEVIKKNWKQSLIAGIINVILTLLIAFAAYFYYEQYLATGSIIWVGGFSLMLSILMMFKFARYYMWNMIMTFDLKLKDVYKNSFRLALANLWRNFLVGILLLLTYAFYIAIMYFLNYVAVWVLMGVLAVCTLPAYRFLMIQFAAFPAIKKYIIDPYYEQHPDLDIEKRRDLGVLD